MLVTHLVQSGRPAKILTGLAFITAFDLFTRPAETLEITREDVVVTRVGRGQQVSIVIASAARPNLPVEEETPAERKIQVAVLNDEGNDTVVAGLPGLGLEWVAYLLLTLRAFTASGKRIFRGLTLDVYERLVGIGALDSGLGALGITPLGARHGGASLTANLKLLTLSGIKKRGRWKETASVKKAATLTRMVARMDRAVVLLGERLRTSGELREAALDAVQLLSLNVADSNLTRVGDRKCGALTGPTHPPQLR